MKAAISPVVTTPSRLPNFASASPSAFMTAQVKTPWPSCPSSATWVSVEAAMVARPVARVSLSIAVFSSTPQVIAAVDGEAVPRDEEDEDVVALHPDRRLLERLPQL